MDNKSKDHDIVIRRARREDMSSVAEMIQELADFEKMPDGPKLTAAELERDGFGSDRPAFECLVATSRVGGRALGYALYYPTYSTWEGRAVSLEDLYVRREARRRGIGDRLFDAVAHAASAAGGERVDFRVLEWNDARDFYERKGAVNLTRAERWCLYRLAGGALTACATRAHPSETETTRAQPSATETARADPTLATEPNAGTK